MKNLFDNWYFDNTLFEARVDDVIKKYPNYEDVIRKFSENDPAGNDKYLRWMTKQHIKNGYPADFIVDVTNNFHKNRQRLSKKDIYQWNPEDLQKELDGLGLTNKEKAEQLSDGSKKIYEDDEWLAVLILDKAASCKYGAGTKWCITMKGARYFEEYTNNDLFFVFIINKKKDPSDPSYKTALVYRVERIGPHDGRDETRLTQIFNAEDDLVAAGTESMRYLDTFFPDNLVQKIHAFSKEEMSWAKLNKERTKQYISKFSEIIKFLKDNDLRFNETFVLEYQDPHSNGKKQIPTSLNAKSWAEAWVKLESRTGYLKLKIYDEKIAKTLKLRRMNLKSFPTTDRVGWMDETFEIFSKLTVNDMRTISNEDDIIPIVPWQKLKGWKTLQEAIEEDVTNFLLKEFAKAHPDDFKNLIGIWEKADIHSEQYEDYYDSLLENPDILRDIIHKNISKDLYLLLRMKVYGYLNSISAKLKDIPTNGSSEILSSESIFTLNKNYNPDLNEFLKDLEKIHYMSREIYKDKTLSKILEIFVR